MHITYAYPALMVPSLGLKMLLREFVRRAERVDAGLGKASSPEMEVAHDAKILLYQFEQEVRHRNQHHIAEAWRMLKASGVQYGIFAGLEVSLETKKEFATFVRKPPAPARLPQRGSKGRRH